MATTTVTTFDAEGNEISVEEIETPDVAPTVDIVSLADQVAAMNEALDFLILDSLEGP